MIKPLSLGSIVVFLVLTSCTVFESPEVVRDVLLKELPNKTWLTTKIPMNSGMEYTSLVKAVIDGRVAACGSKSQISY